MLLLRLVVGSQRQAGEQAKKQAEQQAGISKKISAHSFRNSFATHLLDKNHDIRTVQELLGHKNLKTTMIYTHVAQKPSCGTQSPADVLQIPTNSFSIEQAPVQRSHAEGENCLPYQSYFLRTMAQKIVSFFGEKFFKVHETSANV